MFLTAAANDLDELTETVTSYISFCEDMFFPTRTHLTYNNDKPWFTAKLRQLRQVKEDAYRKGDKVLYKQAKCTLEKEIRVAKINYSGKLRNKLCSVTAVESFRFLGITISQDLKWDNYIKSIVKKAQQRLYFLCQLKEVQPVTRAAETVLLCHHWIHPLHVNNFLGQLSKQIWPQKTTGG